jgi:hypothetical protein
VQIKEDVNPEGKRPLARTESRKNDIKKNVSDIRFSFRTGFIRLRIGRGGGLL